MARYETLFLLTPEFTKGEFSSFESAVQKLIAEHAGSLISCERWGKYHLAFPVRRNDYGIYGLVRYEVSDERKQGLLSALKTFFAVKYVDSVMRSMTVVLSDKRSLEYHRPESLEDMPARDVDTFLKENNMEGLSRSHRRTQEPVVKSDVEKE